MCAHECLRCHLHGLRARLLTSLDVVYTSTRVQLMPLPSGLLSIHIENFVVPLKGTQTPTVMCNV